MKPLLFITLGIIPVSGSVVFSNTFEDNNIVPEMGSWTVTNSVTSVVSTATAGSPQQTAVGLFDQGTSPT